ncbi:MAG: ABC transporter substrate-binding protein [Clostridia bacterium]|nr:ABC transporter substrate-binding protein [Clostridia bacterium]
MKVYKILNHIIVIVLILSMLLLTTACQGSSEKDSDYTDTFIDALGREVSFQKKPERVAALLGSFADIWTLAGGELCAAAEDAWEDFGLELEDCTNIGGAHSPSLELLISADPDFVIASASTASNVEMKYSLDAMGITVAYFDVDCFDDYLNMLNICTDITERKDLYEINGVAVKAQIDEIKAQYSEADIPESERKILLLRAASSFVKAKGSNGTVLGEMLNDMGCINIADNDSSLLENLSIEAIVREEPHHIFVVTMGSDTEAAKKSLENMIKENSAWNTLGAVKNGRLHIMDKTLFNLKPNDRWAESYEMLYEKLTKK